MGVASASFGRAFPIGRAAPHSAARFISRLAVATCPPRPLNAAYFACLADLTYPNDVIRREHSPPSAQHLRRAARP